LEAQTAKSDVVVCTACYGTYDSLRPVEKSDPSVCYVAYTDSENRPEGWEYLATPPEVQGLNPRMRSKYIKVNTHLLFPEARWTIWLDAATIPLFTNLRPILEKLPFADLYLKKHP